MRTYLLPLHHLKAFIKHLESKGHTIDNIENATLEDEWIIFLAGTQRNRPYTPSWLRKQLNRFITQEETAL